ncbi:MAG: MraY family glycosyltransferase [Thermomicrobiales bacterium]
MIDIDWSLVKSIVRQLLPAFGVAFVAALICVPLAASVGLAVGGTLVDQPRPGEVQRRPISRVGGYGLVAAFFFGIIAGLPVLNGAADRFLADGNLIGLHTMLAEYNKWVGLALGAAFLLPFAAWDDLRRLPPLPQLIAQFGCAAIPIAFGVKMTTISNPLPFGPDPFNLGLLVIPVTFVWIVGMINTLNWLDTMDGLAGGVALISGGARRGQRAEAQRLQRTAGHRRGPLGGAGRGLPRLPGLQLPPGAHLHGHQRLDVPRLRARGDLDHRRREDRHGGARPRPADPRHRVCHPAPPRRRALADAGG